MKALLKSEMSVVQDAFNGILLIDKPPGCTSHDVVGRARRIMGTRSIGHAGTLDPIASGLLILLVGEATKLSNFILSGDKGYEVKIRLGMDTDTLDITGKILREREVGVLEEEVIRVASDLVGHLNLFVPKFSAIKVDGKTLYKEARLGHEFEPPTREMNFYDLEVLEVNLPTVKVRMKCSKGSYVRSWAHALGERLNVGACVESLRRVWSEPYELHDATSLEALECQPWQGLRAAIPIAEALSWPQIMVDGKDEVLLKNGQLSHGLKGRLRVFYRHQKTGKLIPGVKVLSRSQQNLMAILVPGQVEGDFKIARVINNVT